MRLKCTRSFRIKRNGLDAVPFLYARFSGFFSYLRASLHTVWIEFGKEKNGMAFPEKETLTEKRHSLLLKNREKLSLDGVCEVVSFDEQAVLLKTVLGRLSVEGEALHVTKLLLDVGEVNIEGKIQAIYYDEEKDGGRIGLFRRRG